MFPYFHFRAGAGKTLRFSVLALAASLSLHAQEAVPQVTIEGVTHRQVRVIDISRENVVLLSDRGLLTIDFEEASPVLLEALGIERPPLDPPERPTGMVARPRSQPLLEEEATEPPLETVPLPGPLWSPAAVAAPLRLALNLPPGFFVHRDLMIAQGGVFPVMAIAEHAGRPTFQISLRNEVTGIAAAEGLPLAFVDAGGEVPPPERVEPRLVVSYPLFGIHPKDLGYWSGVEAELFTGIGPRTGAADRTALIFAAYDPSRGQLIGGRVEMPNRSGDFEQAVRLDLSRAPVRLVVALFRSGQLAGHAVFATAPDSLPEEPEAIRQERRRAIEVRESARREIQALRSQISSADARIADLPPLLRRLQREIDKLDDDISIERRLVEGYYRTPPELVAAREALWVQMQTLRSQLADMERLRREAQRDLLRADQELTALDQRRITFTLMPLRPETEPSPL
jgi:hypothetical protein